MPFSPRDWAFRFAGKYKITTTGFPPHCAPNSAPRPYCFDRGWLQIQSTHDCRNKPKWGDVYSFVFNCIESNSVYDGFPNTINGGCARDFEEYYKTKEGPGQLLIFPSIDGRDNYQRWIKVTYGNFRVLGPPEGVPVPLGQVSAISKIESNDADIMNMEFDMVSSAECGIDQFGNEYAIVDETPTYYYIFWIDDWRTGDERNNANRVKYRNPELSKFVDRFEKNETIDRLGRLGG
jgi:hypothetical protein